MTAPDSAGHGQAPSAPPALEPASYLMDAVARLWRVAYQIGNVRLRPWDITVSSYAALRVVADRPDLTLAQLSRRNFVRPQTMTRMVAQLANRGWIERHTHPEDGRAFTLRATQEGRAAVNTMTVQVNKIQGSIGRVLDDEEIARISSLLRSCARQVEAELAGSSPTPAADPPF